MNRGLGFKNIFDNNKHRQIFINLLAETSEQFNLEIHGYCLMDNHYHLLVNTPHGNLPRAMRHINGVYTQRYNRDKKSDGPLFRGRYKAILIEGDSYLLQVSRYIHLNPLMAKIIRNLETFSWSSYRYYIGLDIPPLWLRTKSILSMGNQRKQAVRYKKFVMDGVDEESYSFYSHENPKGYLGAEKSKRKLLAI
jgi:putative transposase